MFVIPVRLGIMTMEMEFVLGVIFLVPLVLDQLQIVWRIASLIAKLALHKIFVKLVNQENMWTV